MRVELSYGFQSWTTAVHLERALSQISGVTVSSPGQPRRRGTPNLADGPDALLWVESGVSWLPPIDRVRALPSAAWIIDTHRGLGWRSRLAMAFDVVFVAQAGAAKFLRDRGLPVTWLPLAVPSELCSPGPPLDERRFDVAFVGQAPEGSLRARVVRLLRESFSVAPVDGHVPPDRMMELYRSARVVLNIPIAGDLNMRTFEAAGARSLLVTSAQDGLEGVLPPSSYYLVENGSPMTWVASVRDALDDREGQTRADTAFATVSKAHTYDQRASQVLATLSTVAGRGVDELTIARAFGAAYSRWGEIGQALRLPLPRVERAGFAARALAWRAAIAAKRARALVR